MLNSITIKEVTVKQWTNFRKAIMAQDLEDSNILEDLVSEIFNTEDGSVFARYDFPKRTLSINQFSYKGLSPDIKNLIGL